MSAEYAIVTDGLVKCFGRKRAVDGLSIHVPRGSVYGFLGRNGAGKTTSIQVLAGLLAPSAGTLSVLGLNPMRDDVALHRRMTYMPEEPALYDWMRIGEVCWFASQLWRTWNAKLAESLLERLELSPQDRIGNLSRGMKGKVALTLALAPEPELLILDDPTSGLDAVVRREFMEGIVGALSETGATVFFSSHIIQDVERIAEHVGIIDKGKVLVEAPLTDLKASLRRLVATFPGPPPAISLEGVLARETVASECSLIVRGFRQEMLADLTRLGATRVSAEDVSLEDIFVATVKAEGKEVPA